MRRNLITKWFLLSMLFVSFIMVPVACSSDDGGTETEQKPEPTEPEPTEPTEPEPQVADPANANTIIDATAASLVDGVSTSTVTVQLSDESGTKLSTSGGVVALSATGSALISEITDNEDGTYTATVTNTVQETTTISGTLENVTIASSVDITFSPNGENPAQEATQSTEVIGTSLLRINCGSEEAVTYGDITFEADQYFDDSSSEAYTNENVTEEDIINTNMPELFLTERITKDENFRGPFSYKIPVTDGTYTVKLYFAEVYWGVTNPEGLGEDDGTGRRVFNISMEDQAIFTGYDLYAEHGALSAGSRMYDVEVTDGELTITFEATVNKPKISAIEIFGNVEIGS